MRSTLPLTIAALMLSSLTPAHCAPSLKLAANGKALQPIVVAKDASDQTKAVAAELAAYLEKISGAKFEVTTGDGLRGIVIGTKDEVPMEVFKDELAIKNTYDGKEAFVIRTEPERLMLVGATELGVSHAAFALLEHLGCRWFFPAKEWEVVPHQPDLDVALSMSSRPKLLARRIWYGYGPFQDDKKHPLGSSCLKDYEDWARHNRMASSFRVNAGHAWQTIIANNKKEFEAHPEYFALVKDKRQGPQLCVSNPAVKEFAVKWCLDFFQKNPDREMVSMECSDGDGHCECAKCAKLGSVSNRVFGLANHGAKAVARKFPGKLVGCLAYGSHSEPPDFALEPNVYVQLTMGFIRGRYSFAELQELWPTRCKSMGFYDYYSVWLWDFDKLPGGKGAMLDHIRESIRKNTSLGATSMDMESGNNWGVHGLGYYVANKLMWNPDDDVEAIVSDFYDKAFGPASAAMRRYYERWMPSVKSPPIISRQLVGLLYRDLDEASKLAKDRPDVLARIDQLKHYLRYSHLRWLYDHEKDKTLLKQEALDILIFAYRTRYEYMNHWNAIQTTFAADIAKKFDEPIWVRGRERKPWSDAPFVTAEETAKWFTEGMDFFQPKEVKEVHYDYTKLSPITTTSPKPAAHNQAMQRVERFALHSKTGEPLEVQVTCGTIAWYRDRAAAKWTLEDAKSKVLSEGSLPLDGEAHTLTMKVPAAGSYFFECNDSAAGWRLQSKAGDSLSWLPPRGKRIVPLGQMPQQFFFVPAGTKQLQFFYSGSPVKVFGPDKKVIAEVSTNDEVVSIDVPEGADGQPWSLSPHSPAHQWFFNAPNCFAASPEALLIPTELLNKAGAP